MLLAVAMFTPATTSEMDTGSCSLSSCPRPQTAARDTSFMQINKIEISTRADTQANDASVANTTGLIYHLKAPDGKCFSCGADRFDLCRWETCNTKDPFQAYEKMADGKLKINDPDKLKKGKFKGAYINIHKYMC